MYVSLKYRFFYYRIPKTASTSLTIALRPYLTNFNQTLWTLTNVHSTPYESLITLEKMDIPIEKNFKMIMVVRNPYTRIVSLYNYNKDNLSTRNINTFDSFLDLLEARNNNDSDALKLIGHRIYDNQLLWTHDPHALNLKVFKYEELNSKDIIDYLNIPSLTIPKENFSTIPADQYVLSTEQKEKIYSMYKQEFIEYSYEK